MILKYKTKGNKLKQEKKLKKKKKRRSLDGFAQNRPEFFWTVWAKPSGISDGFGQTV
jgi:hypothetical protein